ncbi:hypothetical protein ABW20_dc0106639 [Dactylellina cionopaga]|nr:hypothetical protein ABW20_dc0106639 [Dactylellina cionopaga]
MASVAIFPPSADISQKGIRTMEDLEMGNTESDRPSPDRSSAPPQLSRPFVNGGRSPESSSLSELDSDDSEAETERLNISPQKPVIGNGTNSASYSTPKKSIGESTLTSPSRSPSPLSTPGQESPKSPDREMTLGAIEQLTPEGSVIGSPVISPGRKRKRAEAEGLDVQDEDDEIKDIMEISDLEEDSPKKKPSNGDAKLPVSDDEDEVEEDEDEITSKKLKHSNIPSTNGHVSDAEEDYGAEDDDESPRPAQRSPGKSKPKLASAKSSPKKKIAEIDPDEDADEGRDTDAADNNPQKQDDEEGNLHQFRINEYYSVSNVNLQSLADEMSRTKRAAAEELATIEILFAQLRDKIVEERVMEIDKEIAMVQDGTHPELVLMSQAIEAHKKEKLEKANTLLSFQLETAERERIANRAALWAQYSQEIRGTREKCFSDANKLWWAIHRERRAADTSVSGKCAFRSEGIHQSGLYPSVVDYVYKIPKSLSTQINHRTRYNAEVSLLSGIAKHVGFPAAPTIMGATTDEVRADLEAMGSDSLPPERRLRAGYEFADKLRIAGDLQLVRAQAQAPVPSLPPPPPSQHFQASTLPQTGPSRLPQIPTFGPPGGYSPRPAKTLAPPPQLGNAFQPSPPHAPNTEIRHPRSPPSPIPQPLNSFHHTQKPAAPPSPRINKVAKGRAAASKPPHSHDALGEPVPKRVPIKLEQSPTISSLSFAPSSQNYLTQQTIDRRMQVGGAPAYRQFGK